MDTNDKPYPLEKFLALSRQKRSRSTIGLGEELLSWAIIVAFIATAIGLLLHCHCFGRVPTVGAADARSTATTAEPKYVWVQLMPDEGAGTPGGRLVRAISTEDATCPTIDQSGQSYKMSQRTPAVRAAFPILLCEFVLIDKSEARIGSLVLPAKAEEPNDIVVIGDTGCRMVYWQIQPCRVSADWPFADLALNAQKKLVPGKSFILHLGDYHYRENPCIDTSTRCGMSPFGDIWATWEKDFFEPAKPLLLAAPWIMMRGNHEDCSRAGAGWIFFFALPGQYQSDVACDRKANAYSVSIGKTEETPQRPRLLFVMDSSDERNEYKVEENCEQYQELLQRLKATEPLETSTEIWFSLHQPLWGRQMNGEQRGAEPSVNCENGKTKSALPVFRKKFEDAKDKKVARLILSGDNHAFQFFWPKAGLNPIQIIAGNGGTQLDALYPLLTFGEKAPKDKPKPDTDPPEVRSLISFGVEGSSLTLMQHGFTVMHREGTTWKATQFDTGGNKILACWFSEGLSSNPSHPSTNCDRNH